METEGEADHHIRHIHNNASPTPERPKLPANNLGIFCSACLRLDYRKIVPSPVKVKEPPLLSTRMSSCRNECPAIANVLPEPSKEERNSEQESKTPKPRNEEKEAAAG
jgi:hypothetical protein